MNLDQLQLFFVDDFTPTLVKFAVLTVLFLYIIFAAVMLRQIQIMNRVITLANFSPLLLFIGLIHLIASIALFILAFVIL